MTYTIDLGCYLDAKTRNALSPNGRAFWREKAKAAGAVRGEACFLMRDAMVKVGHPNRGICGAVITIDAGFWGAGLMDKHDNLPALLKPAIDGIADALWPERSSSRRDADVTLGECRLVEERTQPWFRVEVICD